MTHTAANALPYFIGSMGHTVSNRRKVENKLFDKKTTYSYFLRHICRLAFSSTIHFEENLIVETSSSFLNNVQSILIKKANSHI